MKPSRRGKNKKKAKNRQNKETDKVKELEEQIAKYKATNIRNT